MADSVAWSDDQLITMMTILILALANAIRIVTADCYLDGHAVGLRGRGGLSSCKIPSVLASYYAHFHRHNLRSRAVKSDTSSIHRN